MKLPTYQLLLVLSLSLGACMADDDGDDSLNVDQALATGCTPSRPTSVGGDVFGYPDNHSINAVIGVQLVDAQNRSVDGGGNPCSAAINNCNGSSNYAYFIKANPTISALGVAASVPGMTRSWSECVSSAVKRMYLEGYPRAPGSGTDMTKYGSTMSNRIDVPAGATVRYAMRFPTRFEYTVGANTGNANGWATCHGHPTPVTRINAWTAQPSTACGIRAYKSGGTIGAANGYWFSGPLAAGQCGAAAQPVNIVGHVNCDGIDMQQTRLVNIVQGRTIGAINFNLP